MRKAKNKKRFRVSFQTLIIGLFLPFLLITVLVTGSIMLAASNSVQQDSTAQSALSALELVCNYINLRLSNAVGAMIGLQNSNAMTEFITALNGGGSTALAYVNLKSEAQSVYEQEYEVLDSVLVYFENGGYRVSESYYPVTGVNFTWQDDLQPLKLQWRLDGKSLLVQNRSVQNMPGFYRIVGTNKTKVRYLISFDIRPSFIAKAFDSLFFTSPLSVFLISGDTASRIDTEGGDTAIGLPAIDTSAKSGMINDNDRMVFYNTLPVNGWKIAVIIDNDEMNQRIDSMKHISIFSLVLVTGMLILMAMLFAAIVSRPIRQLAEQVKTVDFEGPSDHALITPDHASEEIHQLRESLNQMLGQIRMLIEDVRIRQNENLLMRYNLLQSQINPHFLYNTLYAIAQECGMGNMKLAREMLFELSAFFRLGLSAGQDIVTLREECEHVTSYLKLFEKRVSRPFTYSISAEEALMDCTLPKMTLQPIVENAIEHSINKKRGAGEIRIEAYLDKDGLLVIVVSDNGVGMTAGEYERLQKRLDNPNMPESGFGLYNINQRIKLYYGPRYGLQVFSMEGEGTTVSIRLEARRNAAPKLAPSKTEEDIP